jgi:hypothetical protein
MDKAYEGERSAQGESEGDVHSGMIDKQHTHREYTLQARFKINKYG